MTTELLTSREVERLLRYSPGQATRLARRGLLPFVVLPDGRLRFRESDIRQIIEGGTSDTKGSPTAQGEAKPEAIGSPTARGEARR